MVAARGETAGNQHLAGAQVDDLCPRIDWPREVVVEEGEGEETVKLQGLAGARAQVLRYERIQRQADAEVFA